MIAKCPELIPKMSDEDKMNLYWFWEKYSLYKNSNSKVNTSKLAKLTKQFDIMLDMTIIKKRKRNGTER